MSIKIVHVSSTQKKSCPTSVILRVRFVNTMRAELKKKNGERNGNSNSYAMDNAKISPLVRFGVPMFLDIVRL